MWRSGYVVEAVRGSLLLITMSSVVSDRRTLW